MWVEINADNLFPVLGIASGMGSWLKFIGIWGIETGSRELKYIPGLSAFHSKDITTSQTVEKFDSNGLGDRSDAFRHGIWNAEMTVLIGKEKAELFATAREDKDVTGNELDGYSKVTHRDMDLHNNEVARNIGENNIVVSENEMSDIIYQEIQSPITQFIWLHE